MKYDRRSPELTSLLDPQTGPLAALVHECEQPLVDVQIRKSPAGKTAWASLYVGLTTVLDVRLSAGRFRLRAHTTHRRNGRFDDRWLQPMTVKELTSQWDAVMAYIHRVIPTVSTRHTEKEGRAHASICSGRPSDYVVADREAAIGFKDDDSKSQICGLLEAAIRRDLGAHQIPEPWWPGRSKPYRNLGTGLDVLAVDQDGRLLAIEAKPSSTLDGITWGPAQVRFYAEVFTEWAQNTPDWRSIVDGEVAQRHQLGLNSASWRVGENPVAVPVLAIGDGHRSPSAIKRAVAVRDALETSDAPTGTLPIEIWILDANGDLASRI